MRKSFHFANVFRSVHLVYDYKTEYNGIAAYRYSTRDDFLNSMEKCFCINKINGSLVEEDGCLYSGALDLTECLGKLSGLLQNVHERKRIFHICVPRFEKVVFFCAQVNLNMKIFSFRRSNCCHNAALPRSRSQVRTSR